MIPTRQQKLLEISSSRLSVTIIIYNYTGLLGGGLMKNVYNYRETTIKTGQVKTFMICVVLLKGPPCR